MRIGGLATIPERESTLKTVVGSIVPQLDMLYVALNSYDHIPQWLNEIINVRVVLADNAQGDAMKFSMCHLSDLLYYTFDDDLIYPAGYCDKLEAGVRKYGGVVSMHGRVYPRPFVTFRKWLHNYHCRANVPRDFKVDLVGSGCACFDTSQLKIELRDFIYPNMADCFLAKFATEQGLPLWVLAHQSTDLIYIPQKNTIWQSTGNTDKQTEIIRSFLR